jgi:O-methyltransferase
MRHSPSPQSQAHLGWLQPAAVEEALARVRPYTMVSRESLVELGWQLGALLVDDVPGNIVECGVWRGGASFLMADLLRRAGVHDRKVWLCDSFEGLPAPAAIDGDAAQQYARDTGSLQYYDNCRATLDDVRNSARTLGLSEHVEFAKGWFESTLPEVRSRIGTIALLRIDADWYASVRCCLDTLYDSVADGGLIVFDDYYTYEGCAIAVHEFFGERKLGHSLEAFSGENGAWEMYGGMVLRKGRSTWQALRRKFMARLEVSRVVPPGTPFLLVDAQQFGWDAVPFLERDGAYWGPPADSATAISELERLRHTGAAFIVFGWPGFWWLTHYADFARYLNVKYECSWRSKDVVIFDLRGVAA